MRTLGTQVSETSSCALARFHATSKSIRPVFQNVTTSEQLFIHISPLEMSGDSRDYYHSSRRTHRSRDERGHERGEDERGLPSIRDVVGDQLDTPVPHHGPAYNLSMMHRALPEVCRESYPSQPGPVLPPINRQDYSSQSRHLGYEHRTRPRGDSDSHHHRHLPPTSSTSRGHSGDVHQQTSQGSYHVFVQSDPRGELVTVSSSSTPHGIVRDRNVAPQISHGDPKKKFECSVCGRRMERQSVYNQHMITHTDERPHICAICGKSFNSKSNLNRHVQTHGSKSSHSEDHPEDRGGTSSSKDYYSSSRRK